jgi:hypothetical protein
VYICQFLCELVVLIICTIVANIGVCEKSKETLLLSVVLISANEVFCSTRLPVQWNKTDIVVMKEVRVCSPYLPENVSGGTSAANERVKKVVMLLCLHSFNVCTLNV